MIANNYTKPFIKTFARACFFSVFIVIDFFTIKLDINNLSTYSFGENGFVEWWQQIQLMISFIVLMSALKKNNTLQPALLLMAGAILIALIREFNNFFIDYVFRGAWSILVFCTAVVFIYLIFKKRKTFLQACLHFTKQPAYGMVLSGFFTTFIFSRLMGIPAFWETILAHNYVKIAERVAEESIETLGYSLLTCGIIDYAFTIKKENKTISGELKLSYTLCSFLFLTIESNIEVVIQIIITPNRNKHLHICIKPFIKPMCAKHFSTDKN